MSYTFRKVQNDFYTVGLETEKNWYAMVDVNTQELALMWVHYLNSGTEPLALPPTAARGRP